MGLFFNNKEETKEEINKYLEDQKALFDTKGDIKPEVKEEAYDEFIFHEKDYSDVPKYKASNVKKVQVVVDKDEFGYQDLNPEINTIDLQKKHLHEDLSEIVNNAPIDETATEQNTSIYDDELRQELEYDEPIEVIEIDNNNKDMVVADVVEESLEKGKKLSIFGNTDEPIQAKVYEVKEVAVEPKIEVIDVDIKEEVDEQTTSIRFNENGNKICPQCGAPLDPNAPVCFLCGNKF